MSCLLLFANAIGLRHSISVVSMRYGAFLGAGIQNYSLSELNGRNPERLPRAPNTGLAE